MLVRYRRNAGGGRCYQSLPMQTACRRHARGFAGLQDLKHWHCLGLQAGGQDEARCGLNAWECGEEQHGQMAKLGQAHGGGQKCHGRRAAGQQGRWAIGGEAHYLGRSVADLVRKQLD